VPTGQVKWTRRGSELMRRTASEVSLSDVTGEGAQERFLSTDFATDFSVSKTPVPFTAIASKAG
jgi:hypothetical protein